MNRILLLAMAFRAINGFTLGLYILVYVKMIGMLCQPHVQALTGDTSTKPATLGMSYLALMFAIELMLQVRAGTLADVKGVRFTLTISFIVRALFFACLSGAVFFANSSHIILLFLAGSLIAFAVAYTTLEGNYEVWLKSLTPDGNAKRAFAYSSAIQYLFTVLGCLLSLACLGRDFEVGMATPAIALMFLLAASVCIAGAILASRIPMESATRTWSSWVDAKVEAQNAYANMRSLKLLFLLSGLVYGLLQLLSAVTPLVIISSTQSLWERFIILAVGSYGPALVGSLLVGWRSGSAQTDSAKKPRHEMDMVREWKQVCTTAIVFAACVCLFACTASFYEHAKLGTWTAIVLMMALALTRFNHGRVDPLVNALATEMISSQTILPSDYKSTLMSYGSWYKNLAGFSASGAAITISLLAPKGNLLAYTLVPASLFVAAATFAVWHRGTRIFNRGV